MNYKKIGRRSLHVVIAERALGRRLDNGEVVHHADGNIHNNKNSNLVVCPDKAYHNLLHMRMRAVEAGYPAYFRLCEYCKQYDDPQNLRLRSNGNRALHSACKTERKRLSRRKVAARRKATDPNFRGGHTFVP